MQILFKNLFEDDSVQHPPGIFEIIALNYGLGLN
jgi:hypothetical protein